MARYTGFGTDRENLIAALDVISHSATPGDEEKVRAAMRKLSNEEPGPRVFTLACTMLRMAILDLTANETRKDATEGGRFDNLGSSDSDQG